MKIENLLDVAQLEKDIENGYVTVRVHPQFPELKIYNYADICQYEPYWTEVTRKTRGLIVNTETGEVVARPFEKFFNYGQETGTQFDLDAPIIGAFDKLDGSLGVAYRATDGSVQIATRGSFESEQAIHANERFARGNVSSDVRNSDIENLLDSGRTPLFEIVYPENRIVVDYGTTDDLKFIGSVDKETGEFLPNNLLRVDAGTLRDVLSLPDRANAEGLVVWTDAHTAIKFKQADYVELHRIVSSLSQKEVWRQLSAGTYEEFVVKLPDEFYKWADDVATIMRNMHSSLEQASREWLAEMPELETRKDKAIWINQNVPSQYRSELFLLLDGRSLNDILWKKLEPVGANPMKVIV